MPAGGIWTVTELAHRLKEMVASDSVLAQLWVKGELSNFKSYSSGHLYFTLKDDTASIKAVMFRSRAARLKFAPQDGMMVLCRGYIDLYDRGTQLQFYVEELLPHGQGALNLAFLQLKERLEKEGLFRPEHKKKLPFFPHTIGVVTSPAGAVISDIIKVARRRFAGIDIVLAPAAVQGDQAPGEIVRALKLLNAFGEADVIIIGRGGGSLEELWAFNTEEVARAIYASRIPVVSAVGHETDYTIADLAADRRAPTPSAAAEMVVPSEQELSHRILESYKRLAATAQKDLVHKKRLVAFWAGRPVLRQPQRLVDHRRQLLDQQEHRLNQALKTIRERKSKELARLAAQLESLSPLAVLARGFAVVSRPEDGLVTSIDQVAPGDKIKVRLLKGSLNCMVLETSRETEGGVTTGE